jgi:putative ABC transport system permease protein
LEGSADGNSPYNVVISERAATKHFGDENPIGKNTSIRIDDEFVDFTIVAVFANIPSNSSIQFDYLVSFSYLTEIGFMKEFVDDWGFGAVITYVEKEPSANTESMQNGLDRLLSTHYPYYSSIAEDRGYEKATSYRQLELQPLLDIHFDSTVTSGLQPSSNKLYSILLGVVALGILLIGCINFMNLSIGRSSNRAKEIGLRKTIGANRKQLISQFLSESIAMAVVALVLALFTVQLMLPLFNVLTEKELSISTLSQPMYALFIIGLTVLTGFMSGTYPAFALSSAKVDDAFSGKLKIGGANLFTRVLVVFQFTLATILIIAMLVVTNQLSYIQNKDLGFSGDQVVVIPNNRVGNSTVYAHYSQVLDGVPGIVNIAAANQTFGGESGLGGMGFEYKGKPMRTGVIRVSSEYLNTMEINLESGRRFNPEIASDFKSAVIVNETCFRDFELELGETFESLGRTGNKEDDPVIIGVMKDFHYNSLAVGVEPMLIQLSKSDRLNYILIKISAEYTFLDETMTSQYSSQQNWSMIVSISMLIAIVLSCFGLFGMVAMAIAGKRSEIGVRKVLGASVIQIINSYSWKYTKLVAIAFLMAIPVSYFSLNMWLESFAYRINLEVYNFIIAGFIIVAISLFTILYKIGEAALANPAHVLRDE